jgi:hypothetical protein
VASNNISLDFYKKRNCGGLMVELTFATALSLRKSFSHLSVVLVNLAAPACWAESTADFIPPNA